MDAGNTPSRIRFLFDAELDNLRRAAAQNDIAFAAAFHFCATEGYSPPQWLVAAVDDLLIELLRRAAGKIYGILSDTVALKRYEEFEVKIHSG